MRKKSLAAVGALVLATSLTTAVAVAALSPGRTSAQPGAPLVYVCSATQGAANPDCTNDQEFEVFDHNGAPIFSVGEFGGAATFGDNLSVFPPNSVTKPSVVESYTTPAKYGSTSCRPPAVWISPEGVFTCTSSGTWSRRTSFASTRSGGR